MTASAPRASRPTTTVATAVLGTGTVAVAVSPLFVRTSIVQVFASTSV